MWKKANNDQQKLAILNQLLPITRDDWIKASISYCGSDNDEVSRTAEGNMDQISLQEIVKAMEDETVQKKLSKTFMKAAAQKGSYTVVLKIVSLKRARKSWASVLIGIKNKAMWEQLVRNDDFIIFAQKKAPEIEEFLKNWNTPLHTTFVEHMGYSTLEEEEEEPVEEEVADFTEDEDVVVFDEEKDSLSKDEDTVELDVPDFMLSDQAFEGYTSKEAQEKRKTMRMIIDEMSMGELTRLAMTGNMEARKLLAHNPKKQIVKAVLANPGITDKEVANLAGSMSTDREVIDKIAGNREMMRSYAIKSALVKNPKTPLRVSLRILDGLRRNDLKQLARSRNIPRPLKIKAQRKMKR